MQNNKTKSEYTLRDKALSLPQGHPARVLYRDYVRANHNMAEEVNAGDQSHGYLASGRNQRQLETVTAAVESAIAETGVTLYHFTPSGGRMKG
jgi:hypothetical protein